MLASVNTSGHVIAMYRTFAGNPKLYPQRQLLSEHIQLHSTLTGHARELRILRTGWLARSEYELAQHLRSGRHAGLDGNRIAAGANAPGWEPFDITLVRVAGELYRDDYVSYATRNTLAARFKMAQGRSARRQFADLLADKLSVETFSGGTTERGFDPDLLKLMQMIERPKK